MAGSVLSRMPSFLEMLQSTLGNQEITGVHVAPSIPPKKLAGVSRYASYGQEAPLVVFDNTTFGSAKSGALITSHALYVSKIQARYPLEIIRAAPIFDDLDGWLTTQAGKAKIPKMLMDDTQEAWERVFGVILSINMGVTADSSSGPVTAGPIGEIFERTLAGAPKVFSQAQLPRQKLLNASAKFPDWCDWPAGERILAYIDETTFGKGDEGLILTDRRLIGHITSDDWNIPYAAITSVTPGKAVMAEAFVVTTATSSSKIALATASEAVTPIGQFLHAVSTLPPDQRCSQAPPLTSEADPFGVATLLSRLPAPEPRVISLLQLLRAQAESGRAPREQALDLVARIDLLAHTLALGRGARGPWLLSPLHGDDLVGALETILGPPLAVGGDQTTRTVDFSLERRGSVGRAAVSSAIGLAALAVVGVGWVSTPGRTVRFVRLSMTHHGTATGFIPLGQSGTDLAPLWEIDEALSEQVLSVVESSEALGLLGRVLWGWGTPIQALLDQPAAQIGQHAAALVPGIDLSSFYPES